MSALNCVLLSTEVRMKLKLVKFVVIALYVIEAKQDVPFDSFDYITASLDHCQQEYKGTCI